MTMNRPALETCIWLTNPLRQAYKSDSSPSTLVKNEQAYRKQPQHSNHEPEIDTLGIVYALTIYIRKHAMKGRVLKVLTENIVGHTKAGSYLL